MGETHNKIENKPFWGSLYHRKSFHDNYCLIHIWMNFLYKLRWEEQSSMNGLLSIKKLLLLYAVLFSLVYSLLLIPSSLSISIRPFFKQIIKSIFIFLLQMPKINIFIFLYLVIYLINNSFTI